MKVLIWSVLIVWFAFRVVLSLPLMVLGLALQILSFVSHRYNWRQGKVEEKIDAWGERLSKIIDWLCPSFSGEVA